MLPTQTYINMNLKVTSQCSNLIQKQNARVQSCIYMCVCVCVALKRLKYKIFEYS